MLTDQSKILPTLTRNARSNAQDLEYRPGCRGARISPPADADTVAPESVSKASPDPDSPATGAAFLASTGLSPTLSGEIDGCDTARAGSTARRQSSGGYAGNDGSIDARGRWMAAELLFSDSEEEILRWRGNVGRGDTFSGEAEGDLFDLIFAADIVYLNDLWDEMAFTMKVRVGQNARR